MEDNGRDAGGGVAAGVLDHGVRAMRSPAPRSRKRRCEERTTPPSAPR